MRIYLDNNATTALDPRVLHAMYHEFHGMPANPSSIHFFGQMAKNALNKARNEIASYLNVKSQEIIFTSGGTEGINLALRGILATSAPGSIISATVEHSAVLETILSLCKNHGFKADLISVGSWGAVKPEELRARITSQTRLIVLSWVNTETGVKNDIATIAEIAKLTNVPLVVDAVGLIGKEPFEIPEGVSSMVFTGHKFHGPKGIGFNYLSTDTSLEPLFSGGGQEYGKRPGTENLEGILGLAKAVQLLKEELPAKTHQMQDLRDLFEKEIIKLGGVWINGDGPRIVSTSNLYFEGVDGEDILMHLDLANLAASHGSACGSGSLEPSKILVNMGLGIKRAKSSLRFSLCRNTTREEIEKAVQIVTSIITKLRKIS